MGDFIMTPTNIDLFDNLFRNPVTGQWSIPILTFNTAYNNPYYTIADPLSDDPAYQKRVIENLYMRLTEKWLYKAPVFRKLLKYFKIDKNGEEGVVKLISRLSDASEDNVDMNYKKYVFQYIEKHFITKRFVRKVLEKYIYNTKLKWYDLFHNTSTVKELFAHKLKKFIRNTILELEK